MEIPTRLFFTDGSSLDGLMSIDEVKNDGGGVLEYKVIFTQGLPQGTYPTHVMRVALPAPGGEVEDSDYDPWSEGEG